MKHKKNASFYNYSFIQYSYTLHQKIYFLKSQQSQTGIIFLSKKLSTRRMEGRNRKGQFLDVTQYVLKEYSPLSKALIPESTQQRNYHLERCTPQIAPIDHDASTFKITPFLNGLVNMVDLQLDQFILDSNQPYSFDQNFRQKHRVAKIKTRDRSDSLILFHLDDQIQGIVEQQNYEIHSESDISIIPSHQDIQIQDQKEQSQLSFEMITKLDEDQLSIQKEFRDKIEKYTREPKKNIIKQIRRIYQHIDLVQQQKIHHIKKIIEGFLIDFQLPAFEQTWDYLEKDLSLLIDSICQGFQKCFKRKIGVTSFDTRRVKLLKYLQKKRLRRWRKKVSYDCRKKVADGRLRIKGKFVNRYQVCESLGMTLQQIYNFTAEEIRQLLQKKMQEVKERSINI